jgi:hypothetical protein
VNIEEHHHNTPEQIEGYLRIGLEVVERVNPPDELRGIAFTKAVDLASNKSLTAVPVAVVPDLAGMRR